MAPFLSDAYFSELSKTTWNQWMDGLVHWQYSEQACLDFLSIASFVQKHFIDTNESANAFAFE